MNLKKIINEYLFSWFQENPYNNHQSGNLKKALSPIKLNGHFAWGMTLGEYRLGSTNKYSPLGTLIYQLKYRGNSESGKMLIDLFGFFLENYNIPGNISVTCMVPPANKSRLYIPMQFILEKMNMASIGEFNSELIYRKKIISYTKDIRIKERKDRVLDLFGVNSDYSVEGKTILLVDDIYDSGTTINECTRILSEAGACQVFVITLAVTRRTLYK